MVTIFQTYTDVAEADPVASRFDRARLLADLTAEGGLIPAGSLGAVVHRYRGGEAYEVEFTRPVHAVLTLQISQIEMAP